MMIEQKINAISRILEAHSIPYAMTDSRIYADEMLAGTGELECVVDVTDWSKRELLNWLGY